MAVRIQVSMITSNILSTVCYNQDPNKVHRLQLVILSLKYLLIQSRSFSFSIFSFSFFLLPVNPNDVLKETRPTVL